MSYIIRSTKLTANQAVNKWLEEAFRDKRVVKYIQYMENTDTYKVELVNGTKPYILRSIPKVGWEILE